MLESQFLRIISSFARQQLLAGCLWCKRTSSGGPNKNAEVTSPAHIADCHNPQTSYADQESRGACPPSPSWGEPGGAELVCPAHIMMGTKSMLRLGPPYEVIGYHGGGAATTHEPHYMAGRATM